MTYAEDISEARRKLRIATDETAGTPWDLADDHELVEVGLYLQAAQVHATLALAEAVRALAPTNPAPELERDGDAATRTTDHENRRQP